jgi:hypothetical protein
MTIFLVEKPRVVAPRRSWLQIERLVPMTHDKKPPSEQSK